MKNIINTFLILCLTLFISGCQSNSSTNNPSISTPTNSKPQLQNNLPKNIIQRKEVDAEKIPYLFYQYINEQNYDEAKTLLSPSLQFQGEPSMRKYWTNLDHVEINNFKDISSNEDIILDNSQQQYYAVKVYCAVLNIKVKDKNLVPALTEPQYRRFVVVKISENDDWLLDANESTPPLN